MSYKPDGKSVADATNTLLGAQVSALASETIMKLHDITANSPEIRKRCNSVTGYMLNDALIFMQFIATLIDAHKVSTASAYQDTVEKFGNGL